MANITQYKQEERMDKFRIYYNETIHPELLILERQRKRLVLLMSITVLAILALSYLTYAAHIFALSLLIWMPAVVFGSIVAYQMQRFRDAFKPKIVDLILDFIDEGKKREEPAAIYKDMEAARRRLRYDYKRFIPIERFQQSGIFVEPPTYYKGEDYIEGSVGSADFEMCELDVRKLSYVRPGEDTIFRGIFFYSNFHKIADGTVVIIPDSKRQFLMSTIKGMTKIGGMQYPIDEPEGFDEEFLVYTNIDFPIEKLLSPEVFESILNYKLRTGKDIYVSLVHSEIYIAVSHSEDILEPNFFSSNARFQLVREFFEDLMLIIAIIEDFDLHY
jgi:hypothetical protein